MGRKKRNTGGRRLSVVDILACLMKPRRKQIAELKRSLEERHSSCNFKKQTNGRKKKNLCGFLFYFFWLSDPKSFERGDEANVASGARRTCTSSGSVCWRGGGTAAPPAEPLLMLRQLSQCLQRPPVKTLYRFTGNSGRSLLTDSQTAVAQGRRGGGRRGAGSGSEDGWRAVLDSTHTAHLHTEDLWRTSGEPLEVHGRLFFWRTLWEIKNRIEIEYNRSSLLIPHWEICELQQQKEKEQF